MLVFDEGDEVHVVLAPEDEDALAAVAVGVRMFQDVEHVAALDVEDDVLESDSLGSEAPDFTKSERLPPAWGAPTTLMMGRRRVIYS